MTHVLFYIGLSVIIIFAVFFASLIKLHDNKENTTDTFEIK